MEGQTLNCPMCGAAASSDSTRCDHCGARLATVACPSCFGLMFVGAKFCSHCGARASRAEVKPDAGAPCPRCNVPMESVAIGGTELLECPRCEGIWLDVNSLDQICADRERQVAFLGNAAALSGGNSEPEKVRYLACPVCNKLMNRVNFAHCSHVVVDVCKQHGTWFDKDELRRIVEFIRGGGLERAREQEIMDLEARRRLLMEQPLNGSQPLSPFSRTTDYSAWDSAVSSAAAVLKLWLR